MFQRSYLVTEEDSGRSRKLCFVLFFSLFLVFISFLLPSLNFIPVLLINDRLKGDFSLLLASSASCFRYQITCGEVFRSQHLHLAGELF